MKLLLDSGARCDVSGRDGVTPLMYAAQAGEDDLVGVMLGKGADPLAKDVKGESSYLKAAKAGK